MLRWFVCIALICCASGLRGAERVFDFRQGSLNEVPKGFRSTVAGQGKPGEWKIIEDATPTAFAPLSARAESVSKRPVLAQLARDTTDEHFPLLVFDEEAFGDFTLTTRFKMVSGSVEQMAGIAFRLQDEKNFYYVRASSLGNTFGFFKVVDGQRVFAVTPKAEMPRGVWHELTIECRANRIRCLLNGQEIIPTVTDNTFAAGKFAFWTKSDAVSYFADTRIVYTPRETLAQTLVREGLAKNPRLAGLRIYSAAENNPILASHDASEVGKPGDQWALQAIQRNAPFYGKDKRTAFVTMPLHDRNGETVGAVRVLMKAMFGQTEQNALARALPVVKAMENRLSSAKSLVE